MTETDPDPRLTRILAAAATRFTADGFEATRIADVAHLAGVAVGTVYLRYPGKAELLAGVLAQAEDRIAAAMSSKEIEAMPFPARFDAIFASIMAVVGSDAQVHRLMGIAPFAMGHWRPGDRIRPVIAAQLKHGQAAGQLRDDIDPDLAAAMAYGLVEGMMVRLGADPGLGPAQAVVALSDASRRWLLV